MHARLRWAALLAVLAMHPAPSDAVCTVPGIETFGSSEVRMAPIFLIAPEHINTIETLFESEVTPASKERHSGFNRSSPLLLFEKIYGEVIVAFA